MASLSATFLCQENCLLPGKRTGYCLQASFLGSFPVRISQIRTGLNRDFLLPSVNCEKKDEPFEYVSVERYPYYSYMDSTSGQYEPASGARAAIPGQELWPEGTASQVRAARAPEPTGTSKGSPSYGKRPGSRRKKYATSAASDSSLELNDSLEQTVSDNVMEDSEDSSSDFVVYQTQHKEEELTGYALDKKLGNPHPFIDPAVREPIEDTVPNEDLWWNWKKPEKDIWSRWQRRRPDVETVFLKAMAETGQVKLYGEHPTITETALYRARRHLFKEERLKAEQDRLQKIGPIAYYSEWVKAWKRDTSREAILKHYEETGEDENDQLIEMFCHQTDREYRIMMGTDVRVKRDPLAMRMREDQIKQIWGGDPVYPTINYIQDPDEIIDFRGPDFHEPTPNMLAYLMEHGKIIPREELEKLLAKQKTEEREMTDMDDAMAQAVDIGENDDEGEESDKDDEEEEKITRNWSVLKSNPELRKSKPRPKKEDSMSLEDAIDNSENLTDFLLDFEEED